MCFAAADAALCTNSQIAVLKYVQCQYLHVDTTLTTITSKNFCNCSIYGKNCYESRVVSGNSVALLGVKMVQQQLYVANLPNAKTTTTVEKSHYDKIFYEFPDMFQEPAILPK